MKKLILFCLGLFLLINVSAWSSNTFNNSLTNENLTFTGNQDITRYLAIPSSVTALTKGFLNLTGFPIERDLIAYWNLNETSGNKTYDITGKYNGTSASVITGTSGIVGTAYNFSSTSAYVTSKFQEDLANLTISLWVYINQYSGDSILVTRWEVATSQFNIRTNGGVSNRLEFVVKTPVSVPVVNTLEALETDRWHHIVGVFNDTHIRLYVNGVLNDSESFAQTTILSTDTNVSFGIQNDLTGDNLNGSLDEIGIWNRALTPDEVSILYNSGIGNTIINSPILTLNIVNIQPYISLKGLNQTNNRTSNLASTINRFLNSTYLVGSNYIIPFIFHSDNAGILQYSDLLFSNEEFIENSQTFNSSVYDTERENFLINITYDSSIYTSVVGSLIFNGTSYAGTSSEGGYNKIFSRVLDIPIVFSEQNKSFYWNFIMVNSSGSSTFNSITNYQIINPSILSFCSTGTRTVNYTIYDEETLKQINNNISFGGVFNWRLNPNSRIIKNLSIGLNNASSYNFCINVNKTFYTDLKLDLGSSEYTTRNLEFKNLEFTNINQNIAFYLLNNTLTRTITLTFKNAGLTPITDFIIKIYRFKESIGGYILIENDITDFFGQASANLIENIARYKIEIYNSNNELKKTIPSAIVVCYSSPCTYQIIVGEDLNYFEDFDDIPNHVYTLSFDNETNQFNAVWIDSTNQTSTHRLEIIQYLFNGTTIVSNQSSSLTSGVLIYTAPSIKATYKASFYRTVDSEEDRLNVIDAEIGDKSQIFGLEGLLWGLVILTIAILAGIHYPPIAFILYLAGMMLLGVFDLIHLNPAIMVAQMIIGALAIWAFRG